MRRIGIIGVGRMGLPIARRLADAGHEVTVHDLRPELARVATDGVHLRWAAEPEAAAAGSDVLLTVLPGAVEVASVLDSGLLEALPTGAVWIDHSSCPPDAAAPLRDRALARGTACLEAPMGGGPNEAAQGTLRLFVGGDAALLDRLTPLLAVYAPPENIVYTGGPGTGYTVKLLVNQLWFSHAVATAEALLLGARLGVDPELLSSVLAGSAASSAFIRDHLGALFQGNYLPSYSLARIHEQLASLTSLARTHGLPHSVSSAVERLHADALTEFGPVQGELLALALMEHQAGLALRPGSPATTPADRPT